MEASVALIAEGSDAESSIDAIKTMNLSELFIVSECLIGAPESSDGISGNGIKNPGLKIVVSEASGVKCPRCWIHSKNADPETGLCPRCAAVVSSIN